MTTWFRMLVTELPLLRDLPDLGERPLPRVGVTLGPAVRGWMLRALAILATGAVLLIAMQRATVPTDLRWMPLTLAVAVLAIRPTPVVAQVAIVVSALLIVVGGHGPFDPVVLGLIPLGYAAVRLSWWAGRVSLAARVEIAALTRGLGMRLVITGGTVGFGALVYLLAGRPSAVAVIAGAAALVVLTWLVFLRKDQGDAEQRHIPPVEPVETPLGADS